MNRSAFIIAVALGTLGLALMLLYLERFEEEVAGGEPVLVLSVVKPLARGSTITEDTLGTRVVPLAYLEDRAVKATERVKVQGLRTTVELKPSQGLLWTDLDIGRDEEADLESLVAPGRRAVTVTAGGIGTASQLIRPGNYVDVVVTSHTGSEKESAKVLLQHVLVLAVGEETRAKSRELNRESGSTRRDEALTLSLSLQEAQLVALALDKGRLHVALRNGEDPRTDSDPAVLTALNLPRPSAANVASNADSVSSTLPKRIGAAP